MAEEKAGQQEEGQEEQQVEHEEAAEGEEQQQEQQAERTYTQAELDRILGKVRKNARYLGRKEAEAELVARGATRQQAEQAVERQEQQAPAAPKRDDFENYEDYLVAKARFEGRQASREEREEAEKKAQERTVVEQRQKVDREFSKAAKAELEKFPEIAEALDAADNVMITPRMGDAIKEAGRIGVHILSHLVDNPEEADRISQLPERAQDREIGKLEARIEAELKAKEAKPQGEEGDEGEKEEQGEVLESEAEEKGKDAERRADGTFKPAKKRAAPEPIEPGSARSASGSSRLPSDKDDIATWMRKEEERERREGRR